MIIRDFDWNEKNIEYRLSQEIEYIQMMYEPKKILIEKGKPIKVYNPKGV